MAMSTCLECNEVIVASSYIKEKCGHWPTMLQVALDMLEFEQSGAFQYADSGITACVGA